MSANRGAAFLGCRIADFPVGKRVKAISREKCGMSNGTEGICFSEPGRQECLRYLRHDACC